MSITASYIVLAIIFLRIPFKKIPKIFSYVLWIPVGIRLVLPFSFNSGFSVFNSFNFFSFSKSNPQTNSHVLDYIPSNIGTVEEPVVEVVNNGTNIFTYPLLHTTSPVTSTSTWDVILITANIIWILGMLFLLVYSIISYIRLANNVKTATLLKDNIFESDQIASPFVFGLIKPKIYLPLGLSENEQTYIIAHEQTHIKRMDYLIKPLAFLILIIHWFNPLIWIAFSLMSKDMEMSCDESVLKKMGYDNKVSYANILLSFSLKRSSILIVSPLAFGETSIKSRIKNILTFKKPRFWIIPIIIVLISASCVCFTANPKIKQEPLPTTHHGYNTEELFANKTKYVGDNSKVNRLINAMPLPAGIVCTTIKLQTNNKPYGISINLKMNDSFGISKEGAISGDAFYQNAILIFSLIDNIDIVEYDIFDNTPEYSGSIYTFTYTRDMVEELTGEDVRPYASSADTIKKLIDRIYNIPLSSITTAKNQEIEKYLETILSPSSSSNPYDYIKAHQNEYDSIIAMGDEALEYFLDQFKNGNVDNSLRGFIIMALCKDLLGDQNNDFSLSPQDWFMKYYWAKYK